MRVAPVHLRRILALLAAAATLTAGAIYAASVSTLTVTLTPSGAVAESAGSATFAVRLSDAVTEGPVTVTVATQDGPAIGGAASPADFTTTSSTLVFAPGEVVKTFQVPISDDAVDELNETFAVVADVSARPPAATVNGAPAAATAVIVDDDNPAFVAVAGPSAPVAEGAGSAPIVVSVTNAVRPVQPVVIGYEVRAGPAPQATPGADTGATPGTWVVASGDWTTAGADTWTTTVSVPITDDADPEEDERFVVAIEGATNVAGFPGEQTVAVTIADDDAVRLAVADGSVTEGNTGSAALTLAVTLSQATPRTVTVSYATAAGTATAGADFTAVTGGTLSFAPGETSKTISIAVAGDTLDEDDETFTVALANPSNATIADAGATGTILDDDGAPTISVAAAQVSEGDTTPATLSFTVSLSAATGRTVTAGYSTADGPAPAATAGIDYTAAAGLVTFAAGETSKTVTVEVLGDTAYEGDELFTVTLANPAGATLGTAGATGTILDNERPQASFALAGPTDVNEPAATADVALKLQLSAAVASGSVSLPFSLGGTATAGADFTLVTPSPLTVAQGQSEADIVVRVSGDALDEISPETVVVTLGTPTGATLGAITSHTITIADDDAMPTVAFAQAASSQAEGAGAASIAVALSEPSGRDVTVEYRLDAADAGSATSGADYSFSAGTLTIPAGQTQGAISVTPADDAVAEPSETVNLILANPDGATLVPGAQNNTHTLTILDNDGPPQVEFALSESSAAEDVAGGTATVQVRLTRPAGANVTVAVAAAGGSATAADYTLGAASVTFAPRELTKDVSVAINDNGAYQLDRTVVLELGTITSNVAGITLGVNGQHTLTIEDDDGPTASFDKPTGVTVAEGVAGGVVRATIRLDKPVIAGDTLLLTLTPSGSATSPADYTAPATVTFAAGESARTVEITIADDQVDGPDKTLTLTAHVAPNANAAIGAGVYELTITDDDESPVAAGDTYTLEEDGALTVAAPGVLGNDRDGDGDALAAALVSGPGHGTVTLGADGALIYTPAANYHGAESFSYRARDAGGNESGVAVVSITVSPVNDAPLAAADTYATPEGVALAVAAPGVLGNDRDVDGEALAVVKLSDPQHGALTLGADGALAYTPDAGYQGVDSFSYRVSDGALDSEPATVTLRVGLSYVVNAALVFGKPGAPDLVGSYTLTPAGASFSSEQQVLVTVTVTNTGTAATLAGFWVDMYVNPARVPSAANTRWDAVCGIDPCRGVAWYVGRTLEPGESVTLQSLKGLYVDDASFWDGRFPAGTRSLYIYVDSWNPTVAHGAVQESNEGNNLFGRTDVRVAGATAPR